MIIEGFKELHLSDKNVVVWQHFAVEMKKGNVKSQLCHLLVLLRHLLVLKV